MVEEERKKKEEENKSWFAKHPFLTFIMIVASAVLIYVFIWMPVCVGIPLETCKAAPIQKFRDNLASIAIWVGGFGILMFVLWYLNRTWKHNREYVPVHEIIKKFRDYVMMVTGGKVIIPKETIHVEEYPSGSGKFYVGGVGTGWVFEWDPSYAPHYFKSSMFDSIDMIKRMRAKDDVERALLIQGNPSIGAQQPGGSA